MTLFPQTWIYCTQTDRQILTNPAKSQQTRLKKALEPIKDIYDYAIIDCAPDLNMSVINALVAAHDILIPIKIDRFTFDGMTELLEQIEEVKEFNPDLRVAGGFVTMFSRNGVNTQGMEYLRDNASIPIFDTFIRRTVKVDESTYSGLPLAIYSPKATAAKDYENLVNEYLLKGGGDIDKNWRM